MEAAMFRKTVETFKRNAMTWRDGRAEKHTEQVIKATWWFLFIPIYSRESITKSTI